MADVENEGRGAALLPEAHRVVRLLDPSEGPFAGALVTCGDGVAVRVDSVSIAGWAAWSFAGAEHVAGPIDVMRRADGHDALLPWCTDRVLGFLVRRSALDSALSSGECSTLVVSLLRGLDELGVAGGAQTGVWWLTDRGRPIFVIGDGDDARAAAAQVLERLAEGCRDKALLRLLAAVQQGLAKAMTQPRVPRPLLEGWERELLAIAAPRPLITESQAPAAARDLARAAASADLRVTPARAVRRADRRSVALRESPFRRDRRAPRRPGRRDLRTRARESIRAVSGALLSRVRSARANSDAARVRSHARRPEGGGRASRRRPAFIVAGVAASVVLAGGLLWPGGGTAGSADAVRDPSRAESVDPDGGAEPREEDSGGERAAVEEDPAPEPSPSTSDDRPVAAAAVLLLSVAECVEADDLVCAGAVAPGSEAVIEVLAIYSERGDEPQLELVDEYGDVAVIRVGAAGGTREAKAAAEPMRVLVLVRHDEKWLVRDVYDVADQPR